MYTAIIILTLIASVLLVLVVLAQNSKGGGVSAQFGGSGASQMIGAQKTTDLLEKITWGLAGAILVFTLLTNFVTGETNNAVIDDPNIERARERRDVQPSQPIAPIEEGAGEGSQAPASDDSE